MKHVYLTRHGETVANRKWVHQGPSEPLSELGRMQAQNVARYFKEKPIDMLMSSTYLRARQTAEIVSEELALPCLFEDTLKEFRRPNHLYGRRHYSPQSFLYLARLFIHQEDPQWDDDGAENMFTVRNRIRQARDILAQAQGEHVIAVSHAIFMDMFIELACKEKDLTLMEYISGLMAFKKTPNTGIIHLFFDAQAQPGVCPWQLVEFIDPR